MFKDNLSSRNGRGAVVHQVDRQAFILQVQDPVGTQPSHDIQGCDLGYEVISTTICMESTVASSYSSNSLTDGLSTWNTVHEL